MATPHALLLKFPGTNCDHETSRALEAVGFSTEVLPVTQLDTGSLAKAQFVVFSGGFSYGDYIMSGRIAQLITKQKIGDELQSFVSRGGYVMGICNGFQILTQLDLLPRGSLVHNASGRFICRWVGLKKNSASPYLQSLPSDFELPIAHAEGRFVGIDQDAQNYVTNGRAALLYSTDVNGSSAGIAAMQDDTGRVFGLMPHPERFTTRQHHYDPDWADAEHGWGHYMFQSVRAAMA
jgi:phosphoribosylformylglycinamidine synthase subunit PurQ / glutaminase